MDRPPFDPVRASFFLVAGILALHCLVILAVLAFCLWHGDDVSNGRFNCDQNGRLNELLTGALAAALAFSGGFARR